MEDTSIFPDKSTTPTDDDLISVLGPTHTYWMQLREYILGRYPEGKTEWSYPGKKFGWSFRIKDKKRAIMYFLPRGGYFKVAFVFGQAAYEEILAENISPRIKQELEQARVYTEGRGIRIDVRDNIDLTDIMRLVEIKLGH